MNKEKFYVTTPIYYVNDIPHIGHAYTTVAADVVARYKRLKGFEVFFLTGTDEYGQKVEKAASAAGVSPKELADKVVERFKSLWKVLNISNDDFIRTTEPRHKAAVLDIWEKVKAGGDIYLGEYEDWYCTPCENFLTKAQLEDEKCPDCGREVDKLKEKSYFFKLSEYQDYLVKFIKDNPGFISPKIRENEVLSFISEGLRDLSISRTAFSWGVGVPEDPAHVMYVWFEALMNYLSGSGYPVKKDFWPPDVQLIGKDILRFHTVFWPAFLKSAGLEPPKKVFAHGWWTVEGKKMSKSIGNVVDPFKVASDYGVDQFRFFLLREVPFGKDGDFSVNALEGRINSELANDLGNLLSRTLSMVAKYRDEVIPEFKSTEEDIKNAKDSGFGFFSPDFKDTFDEHICEVRFHLALEQLWEVVRAMNAYVDKSAPWTLAKEGKDKELDLVLFNLLEGLRITALYLYPFMPESALRIRKSLGIEGSISAVDFDKDILFRGETIGGLKTDKGSPLFPRIEKE
ncbi:MAG: methionine--tRNA ligase [Deltaproteobacteria bacterium]|nr:methionine--tRNA ligase [Deltaproteobacteria bacterium]